MNTSSAQHAAPPESDLGCIRTLLTIAGICQLHTCSIDFTLAFPQDDVEVPIFMVIPFGFKVNKPEL